MTMTVVGVARRAFQPRVCRIHGMPSPVVPATPRGDADHNLTAAEVELLRGLEAALMTGSGGAGEDSGDDKWGRTALEKLADGL